MEKQSTRSLSKMEGLLGPDPLTEALRGKIRETIMTLVEGELAEVLAALLYERTGQRRGYRHGSKSRTVTTGLGAVPIAMPRARMIRDGRAYEWQSHLVRRHERRAVAVDSALLGVSLRSQPAAE